MNCVEIVIPIRLLPNQLTLNETKLFLTTQSGIDLVVDRWTYATATYY